MPDPVYLGIDVGQASDFSALAVLRRLRPGPPPLYVLDHLQRVRGMPYVGTPAAPGLVETVGARVRAEPALHGCHVAVDRTGVGRPVVDSLRAARMPCTLWAVTITAGQAVRREGCDLWVPKRDVVGVAQTLLSSGRLVLDSRLPLAETLRAELKGFTIKITPAGNETFESWREGAHDDLVFAVSLACWLAERFGSGGGKVASGGATVAPPAGAFGRHFDPRRPPF